MRAKIIICMLEFSTSKYFSYQTHVHKHCLAYLCCKCKKASIMRYFLLLLGLTSAFVACSKDDDTIEPEPNVAYDTVAVDLGLSVKWANRNIGAETENELGEYFAWGEVATKDTFILKTYAYFDSVYIFIGKDISASQYDAARAIWGGRWRMPTIEEAQELIDSCEWTWEWGTSFDTFGYRVTGKNGNSIYLPAAGGYYKDSDPYNLWSINDFGYYWTSTIEYKSLSNLIRFNHNKASIEVNEIYKGLSIRPVVNWP